MTDSPLVSVIVPVYNVEKYLEECIESIINQNEKRIEIILINDGSNDRSLEICKKYVSWDERVILINQNRKGVSAARNTGVKRASGQYIGFVDSDDWILPDMYENLLDLALEHKSDITICGHARQFGSSLTEFRTDQELLVLNKENGLRELFRGNVYRFALWNKLYERKCFNEILFPEGRIHEDLAVAHQLIMNSELILVTSRTGYIYRHREKSILTTRFHIGRMDSFEAWDNIIKDLMRAHPEVMSEVWRRYAYWIFDNIQIILKQINDKEEANQQFTYISKNLQKNYKAIKKNERLNRKDKLKLFLISKNFYISTNQKKILTASVK
ncbi:glycosyltransferase family 2 protein [Alkalicoccus daliensis]|uniref:Glycosyltransferase involved in cell wall bisynthesis n=1 Tax=Alkalicoccus daliensis TaxID=745820 RepID=A0A1G9ZLH4_9BACI|nr:glycosyltransferase [Alkalicoccus daliensis]SDN22130.1 Glycosyltransferase involved in cell wall bisynthesis [Alkalicoccus daliensis]